MAAGVTCHYDRSGGDTALLIQNQWPVRPGFQPHVPEFGTTSGHYGHSVQCHADQVYESPPKQAGKSDRISVFYQRTGVRQHRAEAGFRDTKASCTLTETPATYFGILQRSSQFPGAGSLVLSSQQFGQHYNTGTKPSSTPRSVSGSATSRGKSHSGASADSTPSSIMYATNKTTLPQYQRTSTDYGKTHNALKSSNRAKAAGKTESGFLEPTELIATLTRN